MKIKLRKGMVVFCGYCLIAAYGVAWGAAPKGAKAIFDSGEGTSIGMSVGQRARAPALAPEPSRERFVGISYQLMVLSDDGQMRAVSKNRIFRSGERVKILARTNRPGYLTILNIGTSGRTHVLYNEYVDAYKFTEIPPTGNLRFVGEPGTEKILVMLSNDPNPMGAPAGGPAGGSQTVAAPAPDPGQMQPSGQYPPPPPPSMAGQYPAAQPMADPYPPPPPVAEQYPFPVAPGQYPPSPPMADPNLSAPPLAGQFPFPIAPGQYPPGPPDPGQTMVSSLQGAKSVSGAKDIVVDGMESSYSVVSPRNNWRPVKDGMKDLVLESSGGTNYGVVPAAAVADGGILTLEINLKHR